VRRLAHGVDERLIEAARGPLEGERSLSSPGAAPKNKRRREGLGQPRATAPVDRGSRRMSRAADGVPQRPRRPTD
jgi:hypothetical protein